MKYTDISDFENAISKQASALRAGVRYSGAVSAAERVKRTEAPEKASFFSKPGAQLAAAFLTAAIIGGGTYFLCMYLMKNNVFTPPVITDTDGTDIVTTIPDNTDPLTDTENAVTVPADTTAPETDETVTADETTAPSVTDGRETTTPETMTDTETDKHEEGDTKNGKYPVYLAVKSGNKTIFPDGYSWWVEQYYDGHWISSDGIGTNAAETVPVIKYDGSDIKIGYKEWENGTQISNCSCTDESGNFCLTSINGTMPSFDDVKEFLKTADKGVYRVSITFIVKGRLIDGEYERSCWEYPFDVEVLASEETTAPETTAPHTTADTEKPDPSDEVPPAPEDKNGYKLYVNHIDMTKLAYYGVYADGSTVLPFSSILSFFEHGSSEIIDGNTVVLRYGDDEFTLKIKERKMTGNHYSGNWFENKQTKTTVLYIADGSILYADSETVNAFLSEFAGGAVRIDKEKKTVTAVDFYYDEDTRHIPVLNESPSKFNKNGYKLYVNGNKVDSVSFDVSGDGEATMPFAAILNCLEHCEVKDFGSAVYIYYGEAVYELQALSYKLTGGNINGNWFTGKNTLFMAFVVKNKTLYTDIGFLNDFLSAFAGGSATIDHVKKTIEIKDKYYDEEKKEPVTPEGTRYEIPFSDSAFFTVTFADQNEKNPGRVRVDFYVPAKDDGNALVNASYCTFPDGARIRIAALRKTNNAIELFCFCEYSGKSSDGEYSYAASANQVELYYTVNNPNAAFPYAYTVTGKSVSFTYTDGTKDRTLAYNQKDYVPVEALVSSLCEKLNDPDQTVDTSVDPVILYESDGVTESFLQPYDAADPFTLPAGYALFFDS